MPVDPPPTKPYNFEDPKAVRRYKAYCKALTDRVQGGTALSSKEKAVLKELGKLIIEHTKKEEAKAQEQRLLNLALDNLRECTANLKKLRPELNKLILQGEYTQADKLQEEINDLLKQQENALEYINKHSEGTEDPPGAVGGAVGGTVEGEEEKEEEEEDPPTTTPTTSGTSGGTTTTTTTTAPSGGAGTPPGAPGGPGAGTGAGAGPGAGVPPPAAPPPPPPPPGPGPGAGAIMGTNPKGTELLAIPLYTGTEKDPEIWLDLIDRAAATYTWQDDKKAGAACMRLSEKALTWLDSQKKLKIDHASGTWENFKTNFLERFKPRDDTVKASEAIADLRQKSGEDAATFYDRVVLCVELKNKPGFTDDQRNQHWYAGVRDTDIYTLMCSGLNDSLRKAVMGSANPPKNAKDLRKMAIETEAAFAARHSINELEESSNGNVNNESDNNVPNGVSEDGKRIEKLEQELAAIKKEVRCYRCNKIGHIRRECTEKLSPQQQQQQQQSYNNRGRGNGRGNWRGRGGFARGNNWRGNWRGRGFARGRGYGGYNRGRGGYVPQAYFGQQSYFDHGTTLPYRQMNEMNHHGPHSYNPPYANMGMGPGSPQPGLWEIIHEEQNPN